MAEDTDVSHKDLLKGAIKHQKKSLSEEFLVTQFLDLLLQERVIEPVQYQEIQTCATNKGEIHASSLFWSKVLNEDISAVRFMKVMKREKHWICDMMQEYVAKVKSGEWPLHGQPDIHGGFQNSLLSYFVSGQRLRIA